MNFTVLVNHPRHHHFLPSISRTSVLSRSRNLDSVEDERVTRPFQIEDDYESRANKVDREWKQERMELNIAQLTQTVSDLEEKLERLRMI